MKKNRLGIIGGGQLGMFTCIAAKKKRYQKYNFIRDGRV